MPLKWVSGGMSSVDHFFAETSYGTYFIGPRKSDGGWEYATPDEDWGEHRSHMLANLTREEAFSAVEADFAARRKL